MTLTASDPHHWQPVQQVVQHLSASIPDGATVLEIGPGARPFPRATGFVDFDLSESSQAKAGVGKDRRPVWNLDVTEERLPFPDKSWDFVYCRHTIEDSWNPFAICAEMSRIGKRGYIETPSPIAELCRGVDGNAPAYRGYHHHRFIIWADGSQLKLVSKYPLVEYLNAPDERLAGMLRAGPKYWNTYFLWEGSIDARHIQSPAGFNVGINYASVLNDALNESQGATDKFWSGLMPDKVQQVLPRVGSAA